MSTTTSRNAHIHVEMADPIRHPEFEVLFVASELLQNSASSRAHRTLLSGLAAAGIQCRVLTVEPPFTQGNTNGKATTEATDPRPASASNNGAIHWPNQRNLDVEVVPTISAANNGKDTGAPLLSLFSQRVNQQLPQVVVVTSGKAQAHILQTCQQLGLPTVLIWEEGEPFRAAALGNAKVVLAPSPAMAEYLREAYGAPAVYLPAIVAPPSVSTEVGTHVVFDASSPNNGLSVFVQLAAEIDRRRPDTPIFLLGADSVVESSTRSIATPGSQLGKLHCHVDSAQLWRKARAMVLPFVDWQRTPRFALEAARHGVPLMVSDQGPGSALFDGGGLVLPLASRLTAAAIVPLTSGEISSWVEVVIRLFDDAVFAAAQSARISMSAQQYSPEAVLPAYTELLSGIAVQKIRRNSARSAKQTRDHYASRWNRLVAEYPWPSVRPVGANAEEHQGWFGEGTDTILANELSEQTRLVVELGSWLGTSTRFICRHAPHATVICVDHWRGSPEHQNDPRFQELLPQLYETFIARCWEQRSRIVPLRMDVTDGLHAVAEAGLQPDVIFLDADHSFAAVSAQLSLARRLFPDARLVGDDFDWQSVQTAVVNFAQREGLIVDRQGRRGWRLLAKCQAAEASPVPPGRAQSYVLVPHLNGIEWECEQSLRQLEAAGVRVLRRGGCSAIDVARNELLSEALHEGGEAMLFIDADLGFDPEDALRLLARPEDAVAGVYAKKSRREIASTFADGIKEIRFGAGADALYPLKFVAAGFLRVRAAVLRRMIAQLNLPLCNTHWGRGIWPFFQPLIIPHENGKLHYLGEDWAFSHRLAQIGVTPLADASIRLWHWGRYSFGWEDAGQQLPRFSDYRLNI